eukprot:671622-Pelagomonas_calceolata.AAC.6
MGQQGRPVESQTGQTPLVAAHGRGACLRRAPCCPPCRTVVRACPLLCGRHLASPAQQLLPAAAARPAGVGKQGV